MCSVRSLEIKGCVREKQFPFWMRLSWLTGWVGADARVVFFLSLALRAPVIG